MRAPAQRPGLAWAVACPHILPATAGSCLTWSWRLPAACRRPGNEVRLRLEFMYAEPVKLAMTLWHGSVWEVLHEEAPGLKVHASPNAVTLHS